MHVIGSDILKRVKTLKFVRNERAIAFFPDSTQHRDMKVQGLSYEDNYQGNAVAGLITNGRAEVRFHSAFSDERIRRLWSAALKCPELSEAGLGQLFYQGRLIS